MKQNNKITTYDVWTSSNSQIPPRSRLYSLKPCGLGTPLVESLTSYIARLAQAHHVPVRTLVLEEIAPLTNRKYLKREIQHSSALGAFWKEYTKPINGVGIGARDFAKVLQILTFRVDLEYLTLLPWKAVMAQTWLLKPYKAWCPDCFVEWQATQQPIYEPLIWHIKAVDYCLRHQRPLVHQCPHKDCRSKSVTILSGNSIIGYCPRCLRWLGVNELSEDTPMSSTERSWQSWSIEAVGQLLEYQVNRPKVPNLENLPFLINAYREKTAKGKKAMAKDLQISKRSLNAWERAQQTPQLGSLLRLCYCCETSLYELFTSLPSNFMKCKINSRALPEFLGKYQARRNPIPFECNKIKKNLESILTNEDPPPSMHNVARRLERTPKDLREYFPDLCKSISAKYMEFQKSQGRKKKNKSKNDIRKAVSDIYARGEFPSQSRVKRLLRGKLHIEYGLVSQYIHEAIKELGEGKKSVGRKGRTRN